MLETKIKGSEESMPKKRFEGCPDEEKFIDIVLLLAANYYVKDARKEIRPLTKKKWYSLRDAAEIFGISTQTVEKLRESKVLATAQFTKNMSSERSIKSLYDLVRMHAKPDVCRIVCKLDQQKQLTPEESCQYCYYRECLRRDYTRTYLTLPNNICSKE